MKTFSIAIAVLGLTFLATTVLAATPTIYAITTGFGPIHGSRYSTIVFTQNIDLTTGDVTNVTENFIYAGGSGTFDGISAFDRVNGIYYYANDFEDDYLYSTDVTMPGLKAPLDLGAKSILNLAFDNTLGRLYALALYEVGSSGSDYEQYLISWKYPNPVAFITKFPKEWVEKVSALAIDEANNFTYCWYYGTGVFNLISLNLTTGNLIGTKQGMNFTFKGTPTDLFYSPNNSMLYTTIEVFAASSLTYHLGTINPMTGNFTEVKLTFPSIIVTAWTFDPMNGILYAAGSDENLYPVNVMTGKVGKPVMTGTVLSDIQLTYQ